MQVSLIHNDSLILGPVNYNYRMINTELEELEVSDRVGNQTPNEIPVHFSDGLTHLLPIEVEIPDHDPNYYNVGNLSWEIIKDNDVPVAVKFVYPIHEKSLEEVKAIQKSKLKPIRQRKENTLITLTINDTEVQIVTTREERLLLVSKLVAFSDSCNYKFSNTWLEIDAENIQYVINRIDDVVQQAYDWELSKMQEIDACSTPEQVYNVSLE